MGTVERRRGSDLAMGRGSEREKEMKGHKGEGARERRNDGGDGAMER